MFLEGGPNGRIDFIILFVPDDADGDGAILLELPVQCALITWPLVSGTTCP